jgi:antitoxin (DNA-binding transcriptional repressor) of toxin-antitoxin stability system
MKTITAKEFQLQHATILKQVAAGHEYEVTFHKKSLVRLVPVQAKLVSSPLKGSREAFLQSLKHTVQSSGALHNLHYKELRKRMIATKYGDD